jgi:hypothetical protein
VVSHQDPTTFWLNVTHAALGLGTALAFLVLLGAILLEIVGRLRTLARRKRESVRRGRAEVGLTMADGGEPVRKSGRSTRPGDPGR